jgi:tetratricopeptide (TPR) repeat protein
MLDVIREFAARRLEEAGESEEVKRRHALRLLELAEAAEPRLVRAGNEIWFELFDLERDNMRSGIAWAIERDEVVLALRYAVALWRCWRHFGEFAEGRRWLDAALAMPGSAPPELRARALWAAGALAFPQGDHRRMAALAEEAFELVGTSGDRMGLRNSLTIKGMVAMLQARYADALGPFHEAVTICQELGVSWQLGTSYLNLGTALLHAGLQDEATTTLENGLHVYQELGDEVFAARIENTLAHAALLREDVAEADRLARKALRAAWTRGERQGIGDGLQTLAATAAALERKDRAAKLAGAAAAVRETIAARPGPFDTAVPERLLKAIEGTLTPGRWRRAWRAGCALTPDAAVAYALS